MDKLLEIHKKACINREFEKEVFRQVQNKVVTIPVYLSAGQEYISATLATLLEELEKQIFIQHRGHSTYLSFGGNMDELILELLGDPKGCAGGMGGSASIQCKEKNIYGHDGLMGSHGPIATGMCYGNKKFTLCFTGDAAAEEDYFISGIGWAATKELPIWYIVEDNNLSILTEKKVRRCWEMDDVARAFKMNAYNLSDDPKELSEIVRIADKNKPLLLNINTKRLFWHAGAGIDDVNMFDRHKEYVDYFGDKYSKDAEEIVRETWKKHLR